MSVMGSPVRDVFEDVVRRQREELLQPIRGGDLGEQFAGFRKSAGVEARVANLLTDAPVFLVHALLYQGVRLRATVIERRAMLDPLPDLRA